MPLDPDLVRVTVALSRLAYRSTQEVEAGAGGLGLHDVRHYSGASTQAFTATDGARLHLAFRGTESTNPVDWSRDAQFRPVPGELGGRVHSGFRLALDEVWADVAANLATAALPVVATGHSLGAALATLAAARIVEAGLAVSAVCTYGQPRTGLRDFARAYDGRLEAVTFRFVNHIDLVTRVPLLAQGYWHVGRRMYFDAGGGFHPDAGLWQVARDDLAYRFRHFGRIQSIGLGPHEIGRYVDLAGRI